MFVSEVVRINTFCSFYNDLTEAVLVAVPVVVAVVVVLVIILVVSVGLTSYT